MGICWNLCPLVVPGALLPQVGGDTGYIAKPKFLELNSEAVYNCVKPSLTDMVGFRNSQDFVPADSWKERRFYRATKHQFKWIVAQMTILTFEMMLFAELWLFTHPIDMYLYLSMESWKFDPYPQLPRCQKWCWPCDKLIQSPTWPRKKSW